MSAFVPGPWGCGDTSNHAHDYRLSRPDGSYLEVYAPYNDHSQQRATARLIAAAPDMYDALGVLATIAKTVNSMQHAGVEVGPDIWSLLHDATIRAMAALDLADNGRER